MWAPSKGGFGYRFDITGKAAHSGVNFTEGASAIAELAHKINALHALTNVEDGMTLNVGLVGGGVSVNTVAPMASGEVDVRFVTNAQRDALIEAIDAIMATSSVSGTSTKAVRDSDFFPLVPTPQSEELTSRYRKDYRPRYCWRVHRWLCRFRLCRKCRRADDLRRRPGRRQATYGGRVYRNRHPCAAGTGSGAYHLRHGAIAKAASIDAAPRQTRRPQSTQPCLKTSFCAARRGQQQARLAARDAGH
ncbi:MULTISPECIES: peptidase dimerization domain-containing protein [Mesorhizobium]|uniref:peptidase dimerization domain-containing protein n=1 Tax=Mesorhizobium norvegicum TaxID=1085774 RepID=UPI0010A96348